jgi:hypothetical protein
MPYCYVSRPTKQHSTLFVILLPILNRTFLNVMNERMNVLPNDLWSICLTKVLFDSTPIELGPCEMLAMLAPYQSRHLAN